MLISPEQQLILVSGKGGVGKSTLASALALELAQAGQLVWLVSADPAHSIQDVLDQPVTGVPTPVVGFPNWYTLALDAERELLTFRQRYQQAVQQITSHSSILEGSDLMPLWDLTWPGFDEVMAVLSVSEVVLNRQAQTVILDMAPTGHAMRLLTYPDFIERLLAVFQALQNKHLEMSKTFGGTYIPGEADDFLARFTQLLGGLNQLLRDPARTRTWVVLLAEELSVPETQRFLSFLDTAQIQVGGVVVNQVLIPTNDCPQCHSWAAVQQERLSRWEYPPHLPLWQIPLLATEPIGLESLTWLRQQITPLQLTPLTAAQPLDPMPPQGIGLPDYIALGIPLVVLAGKGGVGKTTTAAALALAQAQRYPDKRVLIVSIDPAHSLGDVFDQPLGPLPVALCANLWGQEVDPQETLAEVLTSIRSALHALDREQLSIEEVQTWQYLLEDPPPGLDEVAALLNVINAEQRWDLIIIDTAPTGHLLRFLEMPHQLEAWLTYLLRLWVKYRNLFPDAALAQQFRTWRQQVIQLQKDLVNGQRTSLLPILTPETTVVQETLRLMERLHALHLYPTALVVNRVVEGYCPLCQSLAQRHQRGLNQIRQKLEVHCLTVPFIPALPLGIEGLQVYGAYLYPPSN